MINDIELLKKRKIEANNNPSIFIKQLLNNELTLPKRQTLPQIPEINWQRYNLSDNELQEVLTLTSKPVVTPNLPSVTNASTETINTEVSKTTQVIDNTITSLNNVPMTELSSISATEKKDLSITNTLIQEQLQLQQIHIQQQQQQGNNKRKRRKEGGNNIGNTKIMPEAGEKVRGRVYTPEKPTSFNKLWNDEEQKRLEELLTIYPEEEIAAHRWSKIAKALGNRTPKQVASRTQKYFIRLAKEGKPIPGKPPNLDVYIKNKKDKDNADYNNINNNNSPTNNSNNNTATAPSINSVKSKTKNKKGNSINNNNNNEYYTPPPVYMSDDEDENVTTELIINEDNTIDPSLKQTREYQELVKLMKLKNKKEKKKNEKVVVNDIKTTVHSGYKCDSCGVDPIIGVRWMCKECNEPTIDMCDTCLQSNNLETTQHKRTHQFEQVVEQETIPYYLQDSETNYLDPSYMSSKS